MRPVSAAFQEAVRQPVRQDRIEGFIGLWDSETVFHSWPFNETQIIQGSLSITDQLGNGKFGFGGAYTRNLSIKLDLTKFHENFNRTLVNLTDGEIMLFYYLTLEDGTEERVFLGQYFINSEKSSRKFNVLSIMAADGMSKFDTPVKPRTNISVYDAYADACYGTDGNRFYISTPATFFEEVAPNGTMMLTYDNSQIQTNRDLLMWIGELTGTFARERRDDPPDWDITPLFGAPNGRPEMVQIPTKYTKAGTSGNFDLEAFKADNGSIIPADVRFSTDFSDTSIRVTTWNTNYKGKMLTSHGSWDLAPDTLGGTIELSGNPLLDSKSESEAQTALDNIRNYGEELRFCPFKAIFNGNPAIECGDFVYLEPGGSIDETQYRHYGIVTYYKWRFHGKCEIRCASDAVATYTRPKKTEASAQSAAKSKARAASEKTPIPSTKAKSQFEKRVDALEGKMESARDKIVAKTGETIQITGNYISGSLGAVDGGIMNVAVNSIGEIYALTKLIYALISPYNTRIKMEDSSLRSEWQFNKNGVQFSYYDKSTSKSTGFNVDISDDNLSVYFGGNQSFRILNDASGQRRAYINGRELAFKDEINNS